MFSKLLYLGMVVICCRQTWWIYWDQIYLLKVRVEWSSLGLMEYFFRWSTSSPSCHTGIKNFFFLFFFSVELLVNNLLLLCRPWRTEIGFCWMNWTLLLNLFWRHNIALVFAVLFSPYFYFIGLCFSDNQISLSGIKCYFRPSSWGLYTWIGYDLQVLIFIPNFCMSESILPGWGSERSSKVIP